MATGTNGIATVGDLIYGKDLNPPWSGADLGYCPSANQIVDDMGGVINGSYLANQLVKYSDVSKRIKQFTLSINTSIDYSSLALFPANGTPNPAYSYTLLRRVAQGVRTYVITFNQGAGIRVNNPSVPGGTFNIHSGSQYRVFGKVSTVSSWTLIATLTHVDAERSEYI